MGTIQTQSPGNCALRCLAVLLAALFLAPAPVRAQVYGDEIWEFGSALALIDEYGPELREPRNLGHVAESFGSDPDSILKGVEERITLVPYGGVQATPVQAVFGQVANGLDRARLVAELLRMAGYEAVIMRVPNPGGALTYGARSPGPGMPFEEESAKALEAEITPRAQAVLEDIREAMPDLDVLVSQGAASPEKDLFWVRVTENGQQRDLLFSDMDVADPSQGLVCDETFLTGQEWQVALSLEVVYGQEGREVLSHVGRAMDLHLVPVTVSIQPEGSMESFTPLLLIGDTALSGQSFPAADNGRPLQSASLRLRLSGPGETREYAREMVAPPGVANEHERGFEITSAMRLTVAAGPVSDEEFAAATSMALVRLAGLVFEPDTVDESRPVNDLSLAAVGLLDSIHRAAGHVGPGSRAVLAFQARPSMVLERLFVATGENGMELIQGLDVLEPGHGLYGSDVDSLSLAMIEQGLYDAMLEDWLNLGDEAETTHGLLSGAGDVAYAPGRPQSQAWEDSFSPSGPSYVFARGFTGTAPGWRIDPGLQAVPLLDNGTGGSLSSKQRMERLHDICKALKWGSMFIPTQVLPTGALMGALVEYHCKLAEAYERSADALNMVADMIAGNDPDPGPVLEDLENQIRGLGRELANSLATNIASDIVGSAIVRPVASHVLSEVVAPAVRWLGRQAGRRIARSIGHGATEAAESGAVNTMRRGFNGEMARLSRLMRDAGWTREQRRNFFRNFGCFLEGTLVRTPGGNVPIEELSPGDVILARDPAGDGPVPREVLHVEQRLVAECLNITLANGEVIRTSAGHPMYMPEPGMWLNAGEYRVGDSLFSEDQGMVAITAMEYGACTAPSYDLGVEGEHTFLVAESGVLAHNNDWCDRNREVLENGLRQNQAMREILEQLEYPPYMRNSASWIPERNATLGDLVEAHYATRGIARRQMPAMHTTDIDGWRGIRQSGQLNPPREGAAWSYNGTLRDGNVAVRVREESRHLVEYVDNSTAFGQNVRYWPDGIGNGTWRPEVPARHLEYYNYNMDRWDGFPVRP